MTSTEVEALPLPVVQTGVAHSQLLHRVTVILGAFAHSPEAAQFVYLGVAND